MDLDGKLSYWALRRKIEQGLIEPARRSLRQRCRAAFSPSLSYGRHFGPAAPTARAAAVMVMLACDGGTWSIPLTVRSKHLPDHPGQVSLPGGRRELGESLLQAAEREFGEELGCVPFPGVVLGQLSPLYVYHSDYAVTPFVAITDQHLSFVPCAREVERIVSLPVTRLVAATAYIRQQSFSRGLVQWHAPAIEFDSITVWGATAIILGELSALLSELQ